MTISVNCIVPPITFYDAHAVSGQNFAKFSLAEEHIGFCSAGIVKTDQVRHGCVMDPFSYNTTGVVFLKKWGR